MGSRLAAFQPPDPCYNGSMRRFSTVLMAADAASPLAAADYYVDSRSGDDANDGLSPARAWKTLLRVNQHLLKPGDRLLFKAGAVYQGQRRPHGSGADPLGPIEWIGLPGRGASPGRRPGAGR